MKVFYSICFLAATTLSHMKGDEPVLPARTPLTSISDTSDSPCPSHSLIDAEVGKNIELLQSKYSLFSCECGGPGWERVAYYDFSRQECPSGFTHADRVWKNGVCEAWSNSFNGCRGYYYKSSIELPMEGRSYSSVCGRVRGHGRGNAFYNAIVCNTSLENNYVGGVSLTHGPPGSRRHVWTFVAANVEGDGPSANTQDNCPCSNNNIWPHSMPDFVGQDYFCDSFRKFKGVYRMLVIAEDESNPLWDGQGCGPTSSCCEFNHPPYFCKHLKYTTSDDMEIRLFSPLSTSPRIIPTISLIEIYVK